MSIGRQLRRDPPHRREPARGAKSAAPAKPVRSTTNATYPTRIALLTILLASVMIFSASRLGPVWSQLLRERVAARELAELESLETYRLSAKFDDWLARGNEGLQWTVTALANPRAGISYAAEQALLRESDSWKLRPRSEAAERILPIAKSLIAVADRLPAARRPMIRRLVERFATWPIDDVAAARELTGACEAIIARLPPASAEELLLADNEATTERRVARVLEPAPVPETLLIPDLSPSPVNLQPPADLPPEKNRKPPAGKKVPKRFFAPRAQELPPIAAAPEPEENPQPLTPPPAQKNINEWVRELADLEVMRLLHHGDYGVRYTAEKDLDRRGYMREHLPLAKQLVHPDPRERRKLAEQLPRLANIDPRPWLLQLAEDDDLEVRRTAEGILQAARPGRESR
jgi:hypothetical protein